MSTYEFQVNRSQDQEHYQTLHGPPMLTPSSISTTPGPGPSTSASTPQPIIIQYDANQTKHPYGTGEHDEGFTMEFENLDQFHTWRIGEEERLCVDFFKVDSHTSKAVPPRFKEHTKLACSRHARAGQKKYIKKFPERQRKTPSKKIEGVGCPATICFKTYVDTPVVRVSYVNHHSHEIGEANLPFTKKYRRQKKGAPNAHFKDDSPIKGISDEMYDKIHSSSAPSTPSEQLHFPHQPPPSGSGSGPAPARGPGPSLPPSPPASMQDPLDLQQMDHQMEHVPYPGMTRMNSYDQSISSHDTSPAVPHPPISPHAQQQQQQQHIQRHHAHMSSHDQTGMYPRPRDPAVNIHGTGQGRDVPTPMTTPVHGVPPSYHPYHRGVEQQQPQQHSQHAHVQPPRQHQHQPMQGQPPHQSQTHPPHHQRPHATHHPISHPPSQPPSRPSLSNQSSGHGPMPQPQSQPPHQSNHSNMPILPDRRQLTQDRWDRMENIFSHIRRQAQTFEFTEPTVSALEMLLVRLYLETPSNTQGGPAPYPGPHSQDHPPPGHGQNMMP